MPGFGKEFTRSGWGLPVTFSKQVMASQVHSLWGVRYAMNWDRVQGHWHQLKGSAKHEWDRLTDDDLDVIGGRKDELIGRLQQRYGIQREEARKRAELWFKAQKEMKTEDTAAFR